MCHLRPLRGSYLQEVEQGFRPRTLRTPDPSEFGWKLAL